MAVKLILIMLVTLSHFHLLHSENGSKVDRLQTTFNASGSNKNGKFLTLRFKKNIYGVNFEFGKDFDKDYLRMLEITYIRPQLFFVNYNMQENVSDHLRIEDGLFLFMWDNIGSSLFNGLLSSGLEKVEFSWLANDTITQQNNDDFQLMTNLRLLDLCVYKISKINESTFNTTMELGRLHLSENELTYLDVVTFQNVSGLRMLDLSHNNLTYLANGLFVDLRELITLRLCKNRLTKISELIFRNLENVQYIDLSRNNLVQIHRDAFNNIKKLQYLYLHHNQLTTKDGKLPFLLHLNELMTLCSSHNKLTRIPSELMKLNSLTEVDLSSNQISRFELSVLRERKNLKFKLNIQGNPLKCDHEIVVFLERAGYTQLASECKHILSGCTGSNHRVQERTLKCPVDCECSLPDKRYDFNWKLITCSRKELITVPEIIDVQSVTSILFDISYNNLTELPKWQSYNTTVTFILASHNRISEIEIGNLPSRLRGLDVSHNNILSIASNVVDHLSQHPSLEIILLIGNPFECSCWFGDDTEKLIDFAQQHKWMTDIEDAKCDGGYELSIKAHEKNCKTNIIISVVIISIFLASVLIVTLVFLFYEHQQFIKVWLFAHNFCLWWVDEEYLDRDKEFDAFISYAQKDVLYVHSLMTELENGTPSYKLFVHDRDFIAGEEIGPAILSAVKRSRRTIIILTKNFIASRWATYEFRCAYRRSIAEKRNCLIVLKHGDIGDIGQFDEVIRSYIQTHTYIESTDKWFWEKIRYALTHKHVETLV